MKPFKVFIALWLALFAVSLVADTTNKDGVTISATTTIDGQAGGSIDGVTVGAGGGGGGSFIEEQDFEETGVPTAANGTWSEGTATVDFDHTATVIAGSESCQTNSSGRAQFDLDTGQTTLYVRVKFQADDATGGTNNRLFSFRVQAGDSEEVWVDLDSASGGGIQIQDSSGSATTVSTVSATTTYDFWVRFTSSGTCSVAFATDGIEPTSGNNFASFTTASSATIDRIQLRSNTFNCVWDTITIDESPIGDF